MKLPLLIALLFFACRLPAATNTCATCEVWEVGPALTNAAAGDVVIAGAGTCEWTNGIWIRNGIRFHGQGTNSTIIIDQLASRSNPLITFLHTNYNQLMDWSQMQLRNGSNTANHAVAMVQIKTTGDLTNPPPFRFHHLFFNGQKGRPIYFYAYANGLVDNCVFKQDGASGFAFDGRIPDTSNKGHLSWSTPILTGTTNEGIFVENCYFTNSSLRAITDQFAGARTVFRYNRCYGVATENHGTESTGEYRGGRWLCAIGNDYTWSGSIGEASVLYRSGTGVVFNNTNHGNWPGLVRFYNHRYESYYAPWRGATGTNAWDTNYNGGEVLVSGTHTGTNGSYAYLVDTNKNWSTNQLAGYTVVVADSTNFSFVSYNNATSAVLYGSTITANRLYFTNGQNYEMRLIVKALDQPGTGAGHLLTGGNAQSHVSPTNTVTGYPTATNLVTAYPNTDDPIYIGNNYGDATNALTIPRILVDRDYIYGDRPGYVQLTYPHPLRGEGGGGGSPTPRTARATNARVKNLRVNP